MMESILLTITFEPPIMASTIYYASFFSLRGNELGSEGGKAIAEAIKVNKSITNIK